MWEEEVRQEDCMDVWEGEEECGKEVRKDKESLGVWERDKEEDCDWKGEGERGGEFGCLAG